jgi:ParB family chromosome partitioning protein
MVEPTLERVPLAQIEVRPQVRRAFDEDSIAELAASICSVGLQQPLLCRKSGGKMILVDGERRWRACTSLGWSSVPVIVLGEEMGEAESVARQLVCNLQREDLNPLDRAEGLHALMQHGSLTTEQVAKRLGMSSAAVTRSLAILKLPEKLRARIAGGDIPADAAYQLSRVSDEGEQADLAEQVATKQLTRDALAKRVRKTQKAKAQPGPRMVTLAAGEGRSITLAGTGWSRDFGIDELIVCLEQLVAQGKKARKQGLSLSTFTSTLKDRASA